MLRLIAVLKTDGAVENKVSVRAVGVNAEIADAHKLELIAALCRSKIGLDKAVDDGL